MSSQTEKPSWSKSELANAKKIAATYDKENACLWDRAKLVHDYKRLKDATLNRLRKLMRENHGRDLSIATLGAYDYTMRVYRTRRQASSPRPRRR